MRAVDGSLGHRGGGQVGPRSSSGAEDSVDHLIARLAARRLGVVSRAELLAAGVTRRQIEGRLASGRLHLLHRGVYAVGHRALHPRAPLVAALLAAGPDPVLGHRTAVEHWEMLPPGQGPVHVLRAGSRPTCRPGLVLHRAVLLPAERRVHRGLPVTSPARSLHDLAASEPESLEAAVDEALARRLIRPGELAARDGRRGARHLRDLLEDRPGFTRSHAERAFLQLIGKGHLLRPRANARVGRWEVDFLWPEQRLVVEIDGYAAHSGPRAFERDRRKGSELQAQDYRVVHFTFRQIAGEPERILATVATLLAVSAPGR